MKTHLIVEFDKMRKTIKTNKESKKVLSEFRKQLVRTEKHSELLGQHFDYALNSGELSDRYAKEIGLL